MIKPPHRSSNDLRYWRLDVTALLAQAGPGWKCVEYLMGNHTIAEQMYRHDPTALLHAPLRTMIHADRDGATFFTIDQPSTLFSNFDNADIAATGRHLDALVVGLLDAMDAPVPAELRLVGAAS